MTCGIYGLFDAETDECLYVGLSRDIEARWRTHLTKLKNGSHLRTDFVVWFRLHKNDPSSIRWVVLEECSKKDLNKNELKWFLDLKPKFFSHRPSLKNKNEHSEETRKKISQSINEYNQKRKENLPFIDFLCEICSKTFKAKRFRKYCSNTCKKKVSKRKILPTPEIEAQIQQLYNVEFKTMLEISKILGISDASVQGLMVEFGIERRTAGFSRNKRPKIKEDQKKKFRQSMSKRIKVECDTCYEYFIEGWPLSTHKKTCLTPWPHCLHCNKRLSKRTAKYCFDHRFPSMR